MRSTGDNRSEERDRRTIRACQATRAFALTVIALLLTMALALSVQATAEATVPSWPFMSVTGRFSAVDLVWDPPDSDGGSPLTAFNLYKGTSPTSLALYQTLAPTALSYTDADVVNGVYYYYSLSAVNAIGEGQGTGPTLAIPGDEPGPPREFAGQASGSLIYMTWEPPEYYGGCDILKYIIYTGQSFEGGTLVHIEDTQANVTSYSFGWKSHFSPGFTAFFKIIAHNAVGPGAFSNGLFITMPTESTAPGAPKNVIATPGSLNVTLGWEPPDSDGGSAITGYEVMRGTSPGASELLAQLGTVQVFVDSSVQAGVTYYYSVRAINAVGSSPVTEEVPVLVPASVPSAPGSMTVIPGDGRAVLSWTAPSMDGGAAVSGYKVYRGSSPGAMALIVTLEDVLTYTDEGLENGVAYYYSVTALNEVGESTASSTASVTPEQASSEGGDSTMLIVAVVAVAAVAGVVAIWWFTRGRGSKP